MSIQTSGIIFHAFRQKDQSALSVFGAIVFHFRSRFYSANNTNAYCCFLLFVGKNKVSGMHIVISWELGIIFFFLTEEFFCLIFFFFLQVE